MGLCGDRLWCALSPSLLWYGPPPSLRCGVGLGLVVGCLLVFWVPWLVVGWLLVGWLVGGLLSLAGWVAS